MGKKQNAGQSLKSRILAGLLTASLIGSTFFTVYADEVSSSAPSAVSEAVAEESTVEANEDPASAKEDFSEKTTSETGKAAEVEGTDEIEPSEEKSIQEESTEENSATKVSEESESEKSTEESTEIEETEESTQSTDMTLAADTTAAEDTTAVDEGATKEPSFEQTRILNDAAVTVTADPGVFPAGSTLRVTAVGNDNIEAAAADAAVDKVRADNVTVAASYVFDISVLDARGEEIEPDTEKGTVKVSFRAVEAADKNLVPAIYHLTEDPNENGLAAEPLKTKSTPKDQTVAAATDGFSLYVVEFTYRSLKYDLQGNSSVPLQDILKAINLTGDVSDAESSNSELFTVTKDDNGQYVVSAVKAFEAPETLTVTINGTEYQISVTDSVEEQTTASSENYNTATPNKKWQYSKSIQATNLDAHYLSKVKISLPSAEEQLTTEVCFVLDKSSFSATEDPALKLLDELKQATENNGAKVTVDIIEFNRAAHDHGSFDLGTQYDEIKENFKKQNSGGTNMHAGLLMAQEVLAKNTEIPDSRKFMILVSDGDSYLYCKNGDYKTPYSRSYIPVENAGGATAYGGYYDESWYNPSAPYGNNVKRPSTSDQAEWKNYLDDVKARNEESNGDSYDFVWKYYDGWQNLTPSEVAEDGFKTQPAVPRSASNLDMGFLNAASVYHNLAGKYHCYAMAAPSWNTADGGHSAFMNYLNNGADTKFESIKNQILYYLDKGSTVDEQIGYTDDYNFDLIEPEKMSISVENTEKKNTTEYPAEKLGDNRYGFAQQDDGTYGYEVTYMPGEKKGDEHFIWKINIPVTNFMRVNLNYQVELTNPKINQGTYGVYDEYGTNNEAGLYVSNQATLNPVSSEKISGDSEEFLKPTVSYSCKGVKVTGTAYWKEDTAGARPDKVTFHLLADGKEINSAASDENSGWKYSFEDLDAVDSGGRTITYTVTEDSITDYTIEAADPVTGDDGVITIDFINTYQKRNSNSNNGGSGSSSHDHSSATQVGTGAVILYKVDGQTGAYLAGAEFALYRSNGTRIGTYTTDTNGCIRVPSLSYGSYYFTEISAPEGYVQDPANVRFVLNSTTSRSKDYPWTIKVSNTKAGTATVTVGGTKIWDDHDNQAGARPDAVTLHLFANGTEVGTAAAAEENGWTFDFGTQAAVDENGNAIQYTVTEDPVAGYTTSVAGPVTADGRVVINVTNTYSEKTTETVRARAVPVSTGDASHTGIYLALMMMATAGLAGCIIYRGKHRN